jgi:hypothetical protein
MAWRHAVELVQETPSARFVAKFERDEAEGSDDVRAVGMVPPRFREKLHGFSEVAPDPADVRQAEKGIEVRRVLVEHPTKCVLSLHELSLVGEHARLGELLLDSRGVLRVRESEQRGSGALVGGVLSEHADALRKNNAVFREDR